MFHRYHSKHAIVRTVRALPMRARVGILAGTVGVLGTGALVLATIASADTTPGSYWTAEYWNSAGTALGGPQPVGLSSSDAAISFTSQFLATLMTKQKADVGNRLGLTVSATVDNEGTGLTYQGEPSCSTTDSTARFLFVGAASGNNGGTGYYTQSWWSNPVHVDLAATGAVSISVPISSSGGWSDFNGKPATTYPAAFAQAASHIQSIGLSFGGGCFFENGVAGGGTLTLTGFSVG